MKLREFITKTYGGIYAGLRHRSIAAAIVQGIDQKIGRKNARGIKPASARRDKPNRHELLRQPLGYYTQAVTDARFNHALRRTARFEGLCFVNE